MSATLAQTHRELPFELAHKIECHGQPESCQSALRLSPELQKRLRCPACGGLLELTPHDCACLHSGCQRRFPIVDGVPVLIDEDSSVFSLRQALSRPPPKFASPRQRFRQRFRQLRNHLPALSANPVAARNIEAFRRLLLEKDPRPCVLVIGGGWLGAGMQPLLADPRIDCVESDVWLSGRTDLLCDAHRIPFACGAFDGVVIQAVLEHVADPEQCVREIRRVLKRGGLVYAETAFMQQVHAGRHDFARFTPVGHRRLFRGFKQLDAGAAAGPAVALAWAWQHFLLSFTTTSRGRARATVTAAFTAFWLKYLDRLWLAKPAALDAASACYFLGARQERELTDREALAAYGGAQCDAV
jgi:SAM-dependent methyltransferase